MANLIEVWEHFNKPLNWKHQNHMQNDFNIVNLNLIDYEFRTVEDMKEPYRINFFYNGEFICTEKFHNINLAKGMLEYLNTFISKCSGGYFWYDTYKIKIDDLVSITCNKYPDYYKIRIRTSNNKIIIRVCYTLREYTSLIKYIQEMFIR